MREIVLDTETTGLDPAEGHRVVEIGAVELLNHLPTGTSFHVYLNPDRSMPPEAFAVHGLSDDFLREKPRFAEIATDFLGFIGQAPLVIHNAAFDMRFLNAELSRAGLGQLAPDRALDTVAMARRRFPGAPASLDALCRRFGIDSSARTRHGALLDAELLAEVYLAMTRGQESLMMELDAHEARDESAARFDASALQVLRASAEEVAAHDAYLDGLEQEAKAGALWRRLNP